MKKFIVVLLIVLAMGAGMWCIYRNIPPKLNQEEIDEKFDTSVGQVLWLGEEERSFFKDPVYVLHGPVSQPDQSLKYEIELLISAQNDLNIYPTGYKDWEVDTAYSQNIAGHDIDIEIVNPGTLITSPGDDEVILDSEHFQPYIILKASNDKGNFAVRISANGGEAYQKGEHLHPDDEDFITFFVKTYLFPENGKNT